MDLAHNSDIWFVFSFVIFIGVLYKFGLPALNAMLDQRIEDIKKDLEEAENLRVEAQEMLAQYQRKHRDAVQEAQQILTNARENAASFRKQAEAELNAVMERREQQLEERLERMQQNAVNEIQSYAADLAMNAATQIIVEKLDKKTNAKLVEEAISDVGTNIH